MLGSIITIPNISILISSFFIMMIMVLVKRVRSLFKKDKKKTIAYVLLTLLAFAIGGAAGYNPLFKKPFNAFVLAQVFFFIMGVIHLIYINKLIPKTNDNNQSINEILFTVGLLSIGLVVFMNVFNFFNGDGYWTIMLGAAVSFLLPLFIYNTYKYAEKIPVRIFKKWYYPLHQKIKEPDDHELKNPLVISLMFQKKYEDPSLTHFRVKAPENMDFGKLFYYFINDYNDKHPENIIEFSDSANNPSGWIFYLKPKWYRSMKYIHPNRTIFRNTIRENSVIVCQRIDKFED